MKLKKTFITVLALTLFFSTTAMAGNLFNEYYQTIHNAPGVYDIYLVGYITPNSPWWASLSYSYNRDFGAVKPLLPGYDPYSTGYYMLQWQYMVDFTGTLKYKNSDYPDDSCYFTDYYTSGNRTKTELNCGPRTRERTYIRTYGFWAPISSIE